MTAVAAKWADSIVGGAQFRMPGIGGARMDDAAVMSTFIGGNTNAPVIMIADRAADLLLGRGVPGSMRG